MNKRVVKPKRGSSVACDECRRRKVRCSAEPECRNCARDHKSCTYSSPWQRLSFLENKLSAYDDLLEVIRQAWTAHVPNVPFPEAVPRSDSARPATASPGPQTSALSSVSLQGVHEIFHGPPPEHTSPEESNPEEYEFDESQNFDSDVGGMSTITATREKSGYTGSLSGMAALKFLHTSLSRVPMARHRSLSEQMITRTSTNSTSQTYPPPTVESLMNDYFTHYHPAYPLLHEGLFRAQVSGAVPKPRDGSWPLLYNMVLAMGAFTGDIVGGNEDLAYYNEAKASIQLSVIERGSLSYVQGLVIMANYLQKRNKPNAGFALIGIAWSMALAIGLHREFGKIFTSPYTMEIRRRTWWTLFVFVSNAQLTFGRPPASLVGVDARRPANLNDASLVVDMDSLPGPEGRPTVSTCLIADIDLAIIGNAIQTELLTSRLPNAQRVLTLDEELRIWEASRLMAMNGLQTGSESLESFNEILRWKFLHLRIVVYRPFLFDAMATEATLHNPSSEFVQKCIDTADECNDSICRFLDAQPQCRRGLAWYATYSLITASLIHAICLANAPDHACAVGWKVKLKRAISKLCILAWANSTVDRARILLSQVIDDHNEPGSTPAAEPRTTSDPTETAAHRYLSFALNFQQDNTFDIDSTMQGDGNLNGMDFPLDHTWICDQWTNAEFLGSMGGFTM